MYRYESDSSFVFHLIMATCSTSAVASMKSKFDDNDIAFFEMLCKAATNGNIDTIKKIIADKKFIENKHRKLFLYNALYHATKEGQTQIVNFLLDYGVNFSRNNYDIIRTAYIHRQMDIVKLFANSDKSLLYNMVKKGDMFLVHILLKAGVDVHFKDDAALRVAIQEEKLNFIEMLLKAGADINKVYDNVLRTASRTRNLDILRILVKFDKQGNWELIRTRFPHLYDQLVAERLIYTQHSCTKGILQASGTCYYNAALHGIILSPRLYPFALLKLHEYIEHLKNEKGDQNNIRCRHLVSSIVHLKVPINKQDNPDKPDKLESPKEVYDEYILNLGSGKSSRSISRSSSSSSSNSNSNSSNDSNTTTSNSIVVTRRNMDEVATFMIMKLLYFYKCNNILQTHLRKALKRTQQNLIHSSSCPTIKIMHDYIQLLASFTIKIHDEDIPGKSKIIFRRYEYVATKNAPEDGISSFPLYLQQGGNALNAFKTMLKYIYGYENYKKNVKLIEIYEDPIKDYKQIDKQQMPELFILRNYRKDTHQSALINKEDISSLYLSEKYGLFDSFEINGIKYVMDHISFVILTSFGENHAIIGTLCDSESGQIPVIVDSNNPKDIYHLDWRNLENIIDSIRNIKKYNAVSNVSIRYICYINVEKYDQKYLTSPISDTYCEENRCEIDGGGNKYTYKKKQYTKYTSSKGTFIVFDGRRRYLTSGGKLQTIRKNTKK